MKILVMWPPQIPSYFNAGHHLPLFMVGNYLRVEHGYDVECLDAGALNCTWKDLGDRLLQGKFDVIAIANDFDAVDDLPRLLHYIKVLSPSSKTMTFGRLSNSAPGMFRGFGLAGIQVSGDYECGVAAFIDWTRNPNIEPPGVVTHPDSKPSCVAAPGAFLPSDRWVLPDVGDIPYGAYSAMYRRDANKFCGIPERRELVVPVARGCPVGCAFCDVPLMQGHHERRLSVGRTIDYIERSFDRYPFEYVAFYAPTFTLKRQWVRDLCTQLQCGRHRPPWKCATTLAHLSQDLIAEMGKARCIRVSVGVETLDPATSAQLPKAKRDAEERLRQVSSWCRRAGIELNCFVIIALPGSKAEQSAYTINVIRELGARVRPTMYTPFNELASLTDLSAAKYYNRQLLPPAAQRDAREAQRAHALLFATEPKPTQVMHQIPQSGGSAADHAGPFSSSVA